MRIATLMICAAMAVGLLCCGSLPCARAATLQESMQQKYARLQGFRAEFTQRLTHRESGSVEQRQGSLLFAKPFLCRWETQKPHAELLVVNTREIWNYLPDEEVAYRYAPSVVQDSRTLIQVITGQARLDKDFDVKMGKREGAVQKLTLYPKEPTPQMVEGALWVNVDTQLIEKAVIIDFYGNTNEVAFRKLTPEDSFDKKAFTFTPPKGTDVEDHTNKPVQERPLLQ